MKTLPNILSVLRICLVPVFVLSFIFDTNDIKLTAVIVFIIANATDILDGYIARKYNAQSKLGKVLDPLGDKLIIFSSLVCIALVQPNLVWVACVYFIKEVLMGIGGFLISKHGYSEIPSSNWLGKTTTVVFFLACAATMLLHDYIGIEDIVYTVVFAIAVLISLFAFTNYLYMFVKLMKNSSVKKNNGDLNGSVKTEIN